MKIDKLSDEELSKVGYNLYERREQILNELNQINQTLVLIRSEQQRRLQKKTQTKLKEEKK